MTEQDPRSRGGAEDYSWLFDDDVPTRANPRVGAAADVDAETQAIPTQRPEGQRAQARRPSSSAAPHATQLLPTVPAAPAASVGTAAPIAPPFETAAPIAPSGPPPGTRPPAGPPAPPPARPRRSRGRLVRRVVAIALALLILLGLATPVWAWEAIPRVAAEQDTADTSGRNILLVGSDKRADMTPEQRKALGTGAATGQRTDSVMLLHVPDSGKPTLVSIPRDSYVAIPGHGTNKINAAYGFGGPTLLVKTIEQATGLHVDGYVEVGFVGFVDVVNAVGGVDMCLPKAMKDRDAHIDLKAGCQQLDGTQALGYVRARHSQARGDLDRVDHQRQLLAAISAKAVSPATLLPWRYFSLAYAGAHAVTLGEQTSLLDMLAFASAMRSVSNGTGTTRTVPVANAAYSTPAGSAVLWDRQKANAFFDGLRAN